VSRLTCPPVFDELDFGFFSFSGSRADLKPEEFDVANDQHELLARRELDYLAAAIHSLEIVDVFLRTLPADRNFQSHKICDATDKRSAIGCFGVPDR
jgi:hypothetical protein